MRKIVNNVIVFLIFFKAFAAITLSDAAELRTAISLSYDDALNSQLDNAVPQLNEYGFKASFYPTLISPTVKNRLPEWKKLAKDGHELGNHSIFHPCRGSLLGREWVEKMYDLDRIAPQRMIEEVIAANTFLFNIDGKSERTFTPPCLDNLAAGTNYIDKIARYFVAVKGYENKTVKSVVWSPHNVDGKTLIHFIEKNQHDHALINIIFHGIGAEHLAVSSEAHRQLLAFLHDNRALYWVDTYINIMKQLSKPSK